MPALLTGNDGSNTLQGGSGADVIYGFDPDGPQGEVSTITANRIASGLSQPLFAGAPAGDFNRLFIVEKTGAIRIVDLATGALRTTPFLDVSNEIDTDGERGLLGLAFHPDFASNGVFFVNLIDAAGDTEIRRYEVSGNPDIADTSSASLVIRIDQPAATNHKAGWLGFGPDGYLYAALGDGGPGNDPANRAQDIDSLLGKMLRLDVDADAFPSDPARNYAVPSDNPFVGADGAHEIWALGLRNPWRNSFDRALGDFYIADVGQAEWEEIDIGARGANYGWRIYEGPDQRAQGTPSAGTLTFPIHAYGRDVGQAITGGYVYRGESEGLHGQYFFGDFSAGKLFTLRFDGTSWRATERTSQLVIDAGALDNASSFGEDARGNLYAVDLDGEVFRLTPIVASLDVGDQLGGGGGDDWLFGGSGGDALAGGSGNDSLTGGTGNDSLDGGSGADTMAGGTGRDLYVVSGSGDVIVERAGEGTDRVQSAVGHRLAANVERMTLTGDNGVNGTGNVLANQITGNSGGNTLEGLDGNDTLLGGGGNDTLRGGSGNDLLTGGTGDDSLEGSAGADVAMAQAGNDTLSGGAGNDSLAGGTGDDSLDGGSGADTMAGEVGNDLYVISGSGDAVIESEGEGIDRVHSPVSHTLAANVEHMTLTGNNGVNGTGNALGNEMTGNGGDNRLKGSDGDDTLAGGSGSDSLVGGTGNDILAWDAADVAVQGGTDAGDALRIDGSGEHLDLAIISGLSGIEIIDLTGGGSNSLTLSAAEVLALSSTNTLRVDGNADDAVTATGTGWIQGPDRVIGTNTYYAYTQGAAMLLVDVDIATSVGA